MSISPSAVPATLMSVGEMAIDTVAAILRLLGDNALDQERVEAGAFRAVAEQWAQHVLVAGPSPRAANGAPPAAAGSSNGRRDWAGVRDFVRDYARGSTAHTRAVLGDLRQIIWLFIETLNRTFAQDQDADSRIKEQLARLASLAQSAASSDLKREALSAVVTVSQLVEERRTRQQRHIESLGDKVRTLGHELETARRESEVDALTRLYNRRAFDEYIARSAELHRAFGHEVCLLLVDIDRFKGINDTYGHTTGDALLCRVADAATRVFLRKSDFVARYGGDEIAVVLRETSAAAGASLAERLVRAARGATYEREGTVLQATVSVGVAPIKAGDSLKTWIDRADRALYRAKQEGRDRFAVENA